eukprot:7275798-Pyramimonas_sp.AAC.2
MPEPSNSNQQMRPGAAPGREGGGAGHERGKSTNHREPDPNASPEKAPRLAAQMAQDGKGPFPLKILYPIW